jgi:hypothetical protein
MPYLLCLVVLHSFYVHYQGQNLPDLARRLKIHGVADLHVHHVLLKQVHPVQKISFSV